MSQDKITFERNVATREGHKIYSETSYFTPRPQLDFENARHVFGEGFDRGYIAATAEANKRIDAIESEVALARSNEAHADDQRIKCIRKYKTQVAELQASNNDLREALKTIAIESHEELWQREFAFKALSATPAESLQAHDDEVIEKCAKVCDHVNQQYSDIFKDTKDRFNDGASYGADDCAECLRALKQEVK